ncbi:arsenate reductase/protein-tyrosine-phosphatase family protein [Microbacterium radiodurans]|uniref:protein-tyrosine-phosphatase n=1 Tax=Microbacterium radiodurans TaxID=661398 RepID=A0A5J5IMM8_9MICO|nr:low molecular weight phosphatase family protein [Microbacterium radiodurans]KAA9084100.1 low molecular weight phosphatase family protein [Microbacterium radiodurans]
MLEILTVCTGNICRSPLAAALLSTRLAGRGVTVRSAGTRGMADHPMTAETRRLADGLGVPGVVSDAHRARFLTEAHLGSPDLILAMSREHRRAVAELAPARARSVFTVREFARLAASIPDAALAQAADAAAPADRPAAGGESAATARLRGLLGALAGQRGLVLPPADPADDDVIDPYRRSWTTYELAASQLTPAIDQVVRVVGWAAPVRVAP